MRRDAASYKQLIETADPRLRKKISFFNRILHPNLPMTGSLGSVNKATRLVRGSMAGHLGHPLDIGDVWSS